MLTAGTSGKRPRPARQVSEKGDFNCYFAGKAISHPILCHSLSHILRMLFVSCKSALWKLGFLYVLFTALSLGLGSEPGLGCSSCPIAVHWNERMKDGRNEPQRGEGAPARVIVDILFGPSMPHGSGQLYTRTTTLCQSWCGTQPSFPHTSHWGGFADLGAGVTWQKALGGVRTRPRPSTDGSIPRKRRTGPAE